MHPFGNLQSSVRTHAVLVIGLYELLDPRTQLIEPPGPRQLYLAILTMKHNANSHVIDYIVRLLPHVVHYLCVLSE